MVEKYALYSGALIKIAGSGHIEGAYVSAKDYHKLESALAAAKERIAELESENARLRAEVADFEEGRGGVMLRCEYTGNPCGTDTWSRYQPCVCANCQRWICEEMDRLRAKVERLTALVQEHQTYTPKQLIKESY